MNPTVIFLCFILYTALLLIISFYTSKGADNNSFFIGNRRSPWYVVAYGMIGASLSGVSFISIPGNVGATHFTYMMIVFGYLLGYAVIAKVLLPVYYRMNLISIYTFLEKRFGFWAYKTGSAFFLLSRFIGASFRMFLVINVLFVFVFSFWNVPFWVCSLIFMLIMVFYTFKGGIKTIVWTDTLQTTFMLLSFILSLYLIKDMMNLSFDSFFKLIYSSDYAQLIDTDITSRTHYLKQFFSGAFIAIVMTGLDQDMMQKNLSCRSLKEAQKNVYWMSCSLVPVNLIILTLGVSLYLFAQSNGIPIPEHTDNLFPTIVFDHLAPLAGIVFIIGLISAAYSSADGAITSLTTSISIDFLSLNKRNFPEARVLSIRKVVHLGVSTIILGMILLFKSINNQSVIDQLFTIAGYTYGPLLGLFSFGLFSKKNVRDKYIPLVAIICPVICYVLSSYSQQWFWGYRFGFELLMVNGALTFLGLWIISIPSPKAE